MSDQHEQDNEPHPNLEKVDAFVRGVWDLMDKYELCGHEAGIGIEHLFVNTAMQMFEHDPSLFFQYLREIGIRANRTFLAMAEHELEEAKAEAPPVEKAKTEIVAPVNASGETVH